MNLKKESADKLIDMLHDSPASEARALKAARRYRADPTEANAGDVMVALEALPSTRQDEIKKYLKLWSH